MTSRPFRLFALAAALAVAADQIAKALARAWLVPGRPVSFIPDVWDWNLGFNPGMAFGLGQTWQGGNTLFAVVAGLACVLLPIYVARRLRDDQAWFPVGLGLVWAGAMGNLIDRVLAGHVTDFVVWRWKEHRWFTFNVADAVLVAGAIIWLLDIGGDQKRHRKTT
ncbi:MAG TPA: signal peptidase II [Haliangiales bacterium]|nr:signal peptidase II [Haliangiales bacterium]